MPWFGRLAERYGRGIGTPERRRGRALVTEADRRWLASAWPLVRRHSPSWRCPTMSIRSSSSRRTVPIQRAYALALGARTGVVRTSTARGGEDRVDRTSCRIPDQEPEPVGSRAEVHRQVAGLVDHPLGDRMRGHAEQMDPAGAYLDRRPARTTAVGRRCVAGSADVSSPGRFRRCGQSALVKVATTAPWLGTSGASTSSSRRAPWPASTSLP